MGTLAIFVAAYLIVSILIGLYAARRVHNATDFMLAGRSLPLSMATFTVFATWFGSETLLGASASFAEEGLLGVIEDPFGAALCLILVGLFFARYFYRLNLLTLSDFFAQKFGRNTEIVSAVCMAITFFAWVAGQLAALAIVMHSILGVTIIQGVILSTAIVAIYTLAGGMWSIAVTDFVQTIVIIVGLLVIAIYVSPDSFAEVNVPKGFFNFIPTKASPLDYVNYFCAWITLGLGSIPSQDIFQRVMSSKNEHVAARSSILAGVMYLVIGMIPLYLAYIARYANHIIVDDNQTLITTLILQHTPLWVQVIFFGALISAILSTASGAILAPASVISGNILKPLLKIKEDKKLLFTDRVAVFFVAIVSMFLAMGNTSIYDLVGEASALGLVSLFVPMLYGMYGKNHSGAAAIAAMVLGMTSYLLTSYVWISEFPSLLIGLGVCWVAYVAVNWIIKRGSIST